MNTSDSSATFLRITSRATLPSIESPETETLDWKARVDPSNRFELAKDVAAFANASGGCLVVGVQEARIGKAAEYVWLTRDDARAVSRAYQESARDLVSPPVTIEPVLIEHGDDGSGNWLVAINVSPTEAIFCGVRSPKERDAWFIPQRVASNTIYLTPDAAQAKTVEKVRSATNQTLALITQWQEQFEQTFLQRQFEEFMASGSHYDIRFPDLKSDAAPIGLQYTIRPVRNETGQPLWFKENMRDICVVKVMGPAHANVMSDEDLRRYDESPIHDGEFYYCEFYNGEWHMRDGGVPGTTLRFYMSGMVGQLRETQSANRYAEQARIFSVEHKRLFMLVLDLNGVPSNSGNIYLVLADDTGRLFLRINDSPPKKVYMTNPVRTAGDEGWYLEIEDLRGYGTAEVLSNIRQSLETELRKRNITIPKRPWHNTY